MLEKTLASPLDCKDPLNKYLVSTCDVVNTVLVTAEAKGKETLKALPLS